MMILHFTDEHNSANSALTLLTHNDQDWKKCKHIIAQKKPQQTYED